jgi:N-acetyl-gamma-glutamyl-phosphate reductase
MNSSAHQKVSIRHSAPGNLKVGIIGGAGFTGGELIRILMQHPEAAICFVHSKSHAGQPLYRVHGDLAGETEQLFSDEFNDSVDLLFLCVGHGEAKKFLQEHPVREKLRIVDLSQDFRLHPSGQKKQFHGLDFVYGLPELNRETIRSARYVANPGCFATAIELGLLPLAKAGKLKEVYATGITGSTGAGQALSASTHFSWRANNIQAYKTLNHQHLFEIHQTLNQLQPDFGPGKDQESAEGSAGILNFVPWRGDFTRGIFVSSQMACEASLEELTQIYTDYYRDHPFTKLSENAIFLKQVVNTNKCLIQLEKIEGMLVIHSIIDNLVKGASGQAVQNMNLMFGLEEQAGLRLKANYF